MSKQTGCIMIARKIQGSEIWKKPSDWLKVWLYLLQEVNHKDNKLFSRGENLFNYQDVARECSVKYNSVAKFIKWAKSAMLVATHKTTRGVVVKVLKYNEYQTLGNYKGDTKSDTCGEIEAKQKRNRSDTITKECKNVRMKEETYISILKAFNSLTNKNYKMTPEKKKQLKNRFEVFTEIEILQAIKNRLNDPSSMGANSSSKIWAYDWNSLFRNNANMDRALNLENTILKDDDFYIKELNVLKMNKFCAKYGDEVFAKYSNHYTP